MTVAAHRGVHEIQLREIDGIQICKFLSGSRLVFGSLLFIANKMGDLSLQEPEP
jgi:hypothetical protein